MWPSFEVPPHASFDFKLFVSSFISSCFSSMPSMMVIILPYFRLIEYTLIRCCLRAISWQTQSSLGKPQTLQTSGSYHAPPFCFSFIIVMIRAIVCRSSRIRAGFSSDPPAAAVARVRASSTLSSLIFVFISSTLMSRISLDLSIATFFTLFWFNFFCFFFGGLSFSLLFLTHLHRWNNFLWLGGFLSYNFDIVGH